MPEDTRPEAKLSQGLLELGLAHDKRVRGLPGTPDIVFQSDQLAIFVHGCFWHQHAECGAAQSLVSSNLEWSRRLDEVRVRDQVAQRALISLGWRVTVVWECHLNSDPVAEILRVSRLLNDAR